ncbi:hypothetical protein [Roseibacillus ishigakijimensis]|uniref:Uncharacterized protein n=1 Tax=Roseibacillus ishigakijimensis TaxID=454146 RepID=A0A934RQ42_9BACT|nr:hypothetical protein [Roseibacillus ishigakijimensis]MBK1833531.1 hypothetical protein [Roseibacillus ishigakijimensis]
MKKSWALGGVFILLLLAALLVKNPWRPSLQANTTPRYQATKSSLSKSAEEKRKASKSGWLQVAASSPDIEPMENFSEPGVHEVADLGRFLLPELSVEVATLDESLEAIIAQYNEVCLRTNQAPLAFYYQLPADFGAERTFTLPAGDLASRFRYLATFFGMQLEQEGTNLAFQRFGEEGSSSEELKTVRVDQFSADSVSQLAKLLGRDSATGDDLHELLMELGMPKVEGQRIQYNEQDGVLASALTESQSEFLNHLLEGLSGKSQKRFETKPVIITTNHASAHESGYYPLGELAEIRKSLAQASGVESLTMESAFARNGESEVTKLAAPDSLPALNFRHPGWRGLSVLAKSSGYGFGMEQSLWTRIHLNPHAEFPDGLQINVEQSGIIPGDWGYLHVSENEGGQTIYILTTTQLASHEGEPLD